MIIVMRFVTAAVGLALLAAGLGFLITPQTRAEGFFILPVGSQGLATIRADIAGFFIAMGTFSLLGAWQKNVLWLRATFFMVALALFGRMISLLLDGRGPEALQPMIAEAVICILLLLASRSFTKSN